MMITFRLFQCMDRDFPYAVNFLWIVVRDGALGAVEVSDGSPDDGS